MALATRCPNCSALFRVAAEQLKSRGGMVRCGSCRSVFNAIGCLDYMEPRRAGAVDAARAPDAPDADTDAPTRAAAAAAPAGAPAGAADAAAGSGVSAGVSAAASAATASAAPRPIATSPRAGKPESAARAAAATAAGAGAAQGREPSAPRTRTRAPEAAPVAFGTSAETENEPGSGEGALTLIAQPSNTEAPVEGSSEPSFDHLFLRATGAQAPADGAWGEDAVEEPGFLRPRAPGTSRAGRLAMLVACVLMVPALAIEAALLYRADAIVHFPELQPVLAALCVPLSCTAQFPMRPDLLAVVSSDLEKTPGTGTLELDAVVRNRAGYPVAVPAMELAITDSLNQAVARKVFLPSDYLGVHAAGVDPAAQSIAPGADLTVRLLFDLPGVNAAGFVAYPFYP